MRVDLELIILQQRRPGIQFLAVAGFRKFAHFLEHCIDAVIDFVVLRNRIGALFGFYQFFIFLIGLHLIDFIQDVLGRHQKRLLVESVKNDQLKKRKDRKQNKQYQKIRP